MKREGQDGYTKLPIKFTYNAATDSYTVTDALNDSKFMEEDGKVFSNYDVDMSSGRTWFEGVKLIDAMAAVVPPTPTPTPSTVNNLDNQVFKIKLLNNNKFFIKAPGAEFRAEKDETNGEEYTFIAAQDQDTYYLQSVSSPDEYVSF